MIEEVCCPACGAVGLLPVLTFHDVPVFCNVLFADAAAARAAPTGTIELVQCPRCATLVNRSFDPGLAEYRPGYENSLHHSGVFQQWARSLTDRLVADNDLRDGTALELGCGSGGFLSLLCDAGMSKAVGYDPSYDEGASGEDTDPRIRIHRGLLDAVHRENADLAVSRHVLEHVLDPVPLVELLGHNVTEHGVVYLEVPNAATMLRAGGVYDVVYEHCTYFTATGMRSLVQRAGLAVGDVSQEFGGQYLSVTASPYRTQTAAGQPSDGSEASELLASGRDFGKLAESSIGFWDDRLGRDGAAADAVVWGAGSKGVTFVNLVPAARSVSRLVDLNPLKRGRFVPGTGQPVVAPEDLREDPPETVVVMNPLYRDEVAARLDALDISSEVRIA